MNKETKNIAFAKGTLPNQASLRAGIGWDNIYFIGIGGIGMSALARYFRAQNKQVGGYDKKPSEVTDSLAHLGIDIDFLDEVTNINSVFKNLKKTLIVYTPAISKDHKILNYFKGKGFNVLKRSQVLGLVTQDTFCLAVAGTHGKTTTTSILGHLMHECHVPVTAFLGGISENYNSNLILKGTEVSVVEADEFDRSFLNLSPDLACITSMDADHLDIYGDSAQLQKAFVDFARKIKANGKLFVKNGLPLEGITYGIEDNADYTIHNIKIKNGSYFFDVKTPKQVFKNLKFNLPGRHNLLNALIAFAMALEYGCPVELLVDALASFKGVKRRFTCHIKTDDFVLIDDYAHHPTEINAAHQAVREMYPNKKILVVFQPHLYSRTRDFAEDFAASLSQFDALLMLEIYPARELPIPGVTASWLLDKVKIANKQLVGKSELLAKIQGSKAEVVLMLGAGDIGAEVKHIKKQYTIAG